MVGAGQMEEFIYPEPTVPGTPPESSVHKVATEWDGMHHGSTS